MSDRPQDPRKQSKFNQEAAKDLKAGGNITIRDIFQQVFQIFLPWSQFGLNKADQEKHFREILINHVKSHWLSDQSSEEKIELQLQKNYDCDAENNQRSPEFTTVADIFRGWDRGHSLLILGEPGAGKTTALSQLARDFVNRPQDDVLSQKLPIVFDLSSWGDEQQPIANWLIKELKTKYYIRKWVGKTWVANGQMVLFLDGLNEVKEKHRSACVEEINQFRQDYGQHEIIVCSRTQEYKRLDKRLTIQHTVLVQPLTLEQINQYLDRCGEELENLKTLLQEDTVLQQLAKTPLMLYIMRIAHENLPRRGSLGERRSHIFNTYIDEIFKRDRDQKRKIAKKNGQKFKEEEEKYQEKDVRTWLKWLADKISKTVFLIEEMQPSWLSQEETKTYRKLVTWDNGMFSGLLFGTGYGTILHYYLLHLSPQTGSTLFKGIFFGMIEGIIVGPAATFFLKLEEQDIKTYEQAEFSWGKYLKNIFKNIFSGVGIGLSAFLICWVIMPTILHYKLDEAIVTGLIAGPFFGIVTVISRATGDSFVDRSSSEDRPVRPNQGIWNSLSHAIAIAIISAVSIGIIYMLIILSIGKTELIMFILGLCTAVLTGLVAIMIHSSGRNCGLHYALRIVLEKKNHIPHNYADFLNYATKLTFMKRIGGGYKFYHPLLQDHFKN